MESTVQQWHFLVNPAAGRGRSQSRWKRWLPLLQQSLPGMTWQQSTTTEGMPALAAAAVRSGKTRLVGVGGDGTHHDILNGIVAANGLGQVTYAPLPMGSGNDWVRTLKTPKRITDWLEMIGAGSTIDHAVGRLHYRDGQTRYFLNVAGMAYDALVLRRAESSPYKHRFLYPAFTLWFLRDFAAPSVHIDYGYGTYTGPVHTINLGIGRYSGGGMRLVPHAEPEAKTLALTFAEKLPLWRIVLESWRFYTGSVGKVKGVTLETVTSVRITVEFGTLELEADGEWLGEGDVVVDLLSDRVKVVV